MAYGLGLWHRHDRAAHGRFMWCAAVPLIDPVLGRLLFFYGPTLPNPQLYQVATFSLATAIAGILVFSYRGATSARRSLIAYFAILVALELNWFVIAPTMV